MQEEKVYTIIDSPNYVIFTIKGVAKKLQVSPRTVRRWIGDGQLKASHLGRRTFRILGKDIIEFLEENRLLIVESDNNIK